MSNFRVNIAGVFVEGAQGSRAFMPSASTFFLTLLATLLMVQFVPWELTAVVVFNVGFHVIWGVCLVLANVLAFQQVSLDPNGITIQERFLLTTKHASLTGRFEENHGFEFDDDDGYTISYSCPGNKENAIAPVFVELRCLRRTWVVEWLMAQQQRIKSIVATLPRSTGVPRPLTEN